jgi:hypothetical protein
MAVKMANQGNIPQSAYDGRWTAENPAAATWPKPLSTDATRVFGRGSNRITDRYIEKGSYLRLKNVSLGYTLPFKMKNISNINIYVSGTNLLTWTNYSWFDTDVNAFGSDAARRGVDSYSYPASRTFSVGAKLTF